MYHICHICFPGVMLPSFGHGFTHMMHSVALGREPGRGSPLARHPGGRILAFVNTTGLVVFRYCQVSHLGILKSSGTVW